MDDFKRPVDNENTSSDPVKAAPAQFEDKETYVTPEGLNTSTPLAITKKPSGTKKWLLGGVVVLLLAGLGAFAYWQYAEAENSKKEVESLRATLAVAQEAEKMVPDDKETEAGAPKTEITTTSLANNLVTAYNSALLDKNFSTKLTKVQGEYALVMVYRANSDNTTTHIYKNVEGDLVELASYDMDGWTESEASYWKSLYGIDAKSLGIPVGPQSTM